MSDKHANALIERIEAVAARYPNAKSAIIPALHLAQEQYGWLPPEAFEAVAEALDTTPAFAQSVASFYDMFHLQPAGKHLIEVCTNVACALNGASEVLGVKVKTAPTPRAVSLRLGWKSTALTRSRDRPDRS